MLEWFLFAAGALLVFKGSDYFVDASVAIGDRAKLPRVVVGGTLVSLATTSPELTVSIIAGVESVPGIAIGNALGSVALNTALILALAAVIRPIELSPGEFRWRSLLMLGLAVLLFVMTLDLSLPRWRGLILLGIGIFYLFFDYKRGRLQHSRQKKTAGDVLDVRFKSRGKIALFFILGAVMLVLGSRLLVNSGTAIAEAAGVPQIFIGLTLVSIGTSLPELATALTSVRKKVTDLSAGNLIGANVLNLTTVTGTAASISPLSLTRTTQLYIFPSILVILAVLFFSVRSKHRLTRGEGVLLIALYVAFLAGLGILNLM